jgi:hypothetical protein|tara:strand:+ start:143 stop:391 length:249 start_codon:yes stop_codon:yes gene_type:complete
MEITMKRQDSTEYKTQCGNKKIPDNQKSGIINWERCNETTDKKYDIQERDRTYHSGFPLCDSCAERIKNNKEFPPREFRLSE